LADNLIHIINASLDRAALALILALALAALWLAPPASSAEGLKRCQVLLLSLIISAISTFLDLVLRSAALADVAPSEAWRFIPRVFGHSDYGFFWQLRVGVWLLMLATMLWFWRKRWSALPAWVLLIASLTTALLISVTGHAGEDGVWSLANLMNWLHIVSTSAWGGAVMLYAIVVLPALRDAASPEQTSVVSSRLSTLATGALVLVLLSGLFNSYRQLNDIGDLWSTEYGEVLLIKLVFVAVMMLIGALNRFHLVPQMKEWRHKQDIAWAVLPYRFLRLLRFDSVVYIAVLIAAVVLSTQLPPSHA